MLLVYSLALLAFAWLRLFREFFELCLEPVLWLAYHIRAKGPGVNAVPPYGPVLVVANHAFWWDPHVLAKILPRPITAMMTQNFYDIWFLRPFMKHVFHAIRVHDSSARREAPEIQEAIAALDRGDCVVIFPEGFLRRKEEVPIRRFGRGVWEILKARPGTPVVSAWIEGGWGSYFSYKDGPPTKNKKFDFRRRMTVGLNAPFTVPAATLENHLATRVFLMNRVQEARLHLGLPPLPEVVLPAKDDEARTRE